MGAGTFSEKGGQERNWRFFYFAPPPTFEFARPEFIV